MSWLDDGIQVHLSYINLKRYKDIGGYRGAAYIGLLGALKSYDKDKSGGCSKRSFCILCIERALMEKYKSEISRHQSRVYSLSALTENDTEILELIPEKHNTQEKIETSEEYRTYFKEFCEVLSKKEKLIFIYIYINPDYILGIHRTNLLPISEKFGITLKAASAALERIRQKAAKYKLTYPIPTE